MSSTFDSSDLPQPFGAYTLLRRIAVGGMAEVYVAKIRGLGGFEKRVAIKVIHPRFLEDEHFVQMLVEEAKLSVLLSHRNIAQTFDLGRLENTYFIVMEYIDGVDAFRLTRRTKTAKVQLPFDVCAYIMSEVCNGLDYAHRKRDGSGRPLHIVHRDISPQNVLLSYSGEVKVIDFGIAKFALKQEDTQQGVIKGKYHYMSPEQAWGDPTDHRSDIFSAGIVLYELLVGEMLYQTGNVALLLDLVRKAEVEPPNLRRADVPWELTDIVMKAIAKRPGDRYQSAHDMGEALRQYLYRASPTFAAGRMSDLLADLFKDEVQQHSIVSHFPSAPPSQPPETEETLDFLLPVMQREEFAPDPSQSVIFRLKDVVDADRSAPPPAAAPRVTLRPPGLPQRTRVSDGFQDENTSDFGLDALAIAQAKLPKPPAAPGSIARLVLGNSPNAPEFDDATLVDDGARAAAIMDQRKKARGEWVEGSEVDDAALGLAPSVRPAPAPQVTPRPWPEVNEPPRPVGAPARSDWTEERTRPDPTPAAFRPDPQQGITGPTTRLILRRHRTRLLWAGLVLLAAALGTLLFVSLSHGPPPPVLEVVSIPRGATVTIDGVEFAQHTPAVIEGRLEIGKSYKLGVTLDGHEPWTMDFVATSGRVQQIASLAPIRASIVIDTVPPMAKIMVDGTVKGPAPVTIRDLSFGDTLHVRATAPGFMPKGAEVVVQDGEREGHVLVVLMAEPVPQVLPQAKPKPASKSAPKRRLSMRRVSPR